jgi:hypothetical protein
MTVLYCLYRKSCKSATGWIPVKANAKHVIFDSPLYLQHVAKYKKTVRAQVRFTLSRVKHLSSLFQHHDGPWSYGDILSSGDALLVNLDQLTMEVFIFPGKSAFAEAYYMNVDKLPANEIRLQAKNILKEKNQKQLECYQGKQVSFLGI